MYRTIGRQLAQYVLFQPREQADKGVKVVHFLCGAIFLKKKQVG